MFEKIVKIPQLIISVTQTNIVYYFVHVIGLLEELVKQKP